VSSAFPFPLPLLCDLVFGLKDGERGGINDEIPNGETPLFYVLRAYIEL